VEHPKNPSGGREENPAANNKSDFLIVATLGTAIGLGFLAASVEALRPTRTGFTFEISFRTFVAFALGAALGWGYWRVAANVSTRRGGRLTPGVKLSLFLLVGAAAFLYPLRFVPREKFWDILIGLVLAAGAISSIVYMLFRLKRSLDRENEEVEASQRGEGE
jgi:hypothetical protein